MNMYGKEGRITKVLQASLVILLFVQSFVYGDDDYYELLGVNKQASDRDIRKAFKKLALTMHPDKNTDDPDAHDKFLKINRAYEVLKDADLRKKYDMYGEEGLKEDGPRGSQWRSWNFYNEEFGIYDDDPEIITLSRSDFEQSVTSSGDTWFVNFYSPQCSHCHHLAPTWREVARELEGVVRIGAVNCGDDWMLCREQGIQSYPSLMMFPKREKYRGQKTREELIAYALKHIPSQVITLTSKTLDRKLAAPEHASYPWLVTACGDGGDCLEKNTLLKLAAMLDELVNIAELDCHLDAKVCQKVHQEHGTAYYAAGEFGGKDSKGTELTSLDAHEIALAVLAILPEVTQLDLRALNDVLDSLADGEEEQQPWLIHFVKSDTTDLELRKLPALLRDTIHVGRVNCKTLPGKCDELFIAKYPSFVLYKVGGGQEFHHGRQTAHDIAAFAKDVSQTTVTTLTPDDFPERVINGEQPWFIDFFAPWCPPCMGLLPEFRKASKSMPSVGFGTVDCTIHSRLCNNYNIRSYPTTIFYNESVPHEFHGQHAAWALVEFIQDMLNPPVLILTSESHKRLVENKEWDEMWLVDYFAPWCGHCQQMAPEWRRLAKMFKNSEDVHVAQIDCDTYKSVCQGVGVRGYPTLRLYPPNSQNKNNFHVYRGWNRDADSLRAWAFEYLPSLVEDIKGPDVEKTVLKSSDMWVVDFYAPWCGHCRHFAPELSMVAKQFEGQVKTGKVNCEIYKYYCRKFQIQGYPTVRFYQGTFKPDSTQHFYGEELEADGEYITDFLTGRIPKVKKLKKDEL